MTVFVKLEKEVVGNIDVKNMRSEEAKLFVTRLGNLANFLKMLGAFTEADLYYKLAEDVILRFKLGEKHLLVNKLRWADSLRLQKHFEMAEVWFQECIQKAKVTKELQSYFDFGLQHLGKLYFDQKLYVPAIQIFSRALSIRRKKADNELLESTTQALKASRAKIKKICVIGNSCSGKTTVSLKLAERYSLPVHHIDSIQYLKGLEWRNPDETRAILSDISLSSEWIIDGLGPLKILEDRMKKADLIVVLRPSLPKLYWRLILRQLKSLLKPRPELPAGCFEATPKQTVRMFKTISNVHKGLWPQLDRIFEQEVYKDKLFQIFTEEELRNLII